MRYQYQQGDRRLVPAGTAQTDDKGVYRVWGLNPGDYYVSAVTRIDIGFGGGGRGAPAPRRTGRAGGSRGIASAVGGLLGGNVAALIGGPGDDQDRLSYAPTYFPGVALDQRSASGHRRREPGGAGHRLQPAAGANVARSAGTSTIPDGTRPSGGNVNLTPEGAAGGRGSLGTNFGVAHRLGRQLHASATCRRAATRCGPAATTARCRCRHRSRSPSPAAISQRHRRCCRPGGSVTGTILFEPTLASVPGRPDANPCRRAVHRAVGPRAQSQRARRQGRRVHAGRRAGRAAPDSAERRRRAARMDAEVGRRSTDATSPTSPIEVRSGQRISNVTLTFTDKPDGNQRQRHRRRRASRSPSITVLAFSTDASLWRRAVAADHDGAARSDRHVQDSRPAGRRLLRGDCRSGRAGRVVRARVSRCSIASGATRVTLATATSRRRISGLNARRVQGSRVQGSRFESLRTVNC